MFLHRREHVPASFREEVVRSLVGLPEDADDGVAVLIGLDLVLGGVAVSLLPRASSSDVK